MARLFTLENALLLAALVLQCWGAWKLVRSAERAKQDLAEYDRPVTYDNFAQGINDMARVLSEQHGDQVRGFKVLLGGTALQVLAMFFKG